MLLPEQIDLRIDNSLVMSNWTLLLPEALIIVPTPGSATMSGSALYNLSEAELAFNRTVLDLSLIISLRADSWLKAVEQDPTVAAQLFAGIKSDQHEKYGWNNVVQQGLHKGLVERLDDVTLSLSIPMFEDYSITAPEVLRVNLPAVALKSNQTIAATPSIRSRRRRGRRSCTAPLSTARTATATRRRASSRRRPSCACATAPTSPSSTSRCATTRSSTASASAT